MTKFLHLLHGRKAQDLFLITLLENFGNSAMRFPGTAKQIPATSAVLLRKEKRISEYKICIANQLLQQGTEGVSVRDFLCTLLF
jgi:hypothetical protein